MSDEIYARFEERSVGVENRIHDFRIGFDRLAPYLAWPCWRFWVIAVYCLRQNGGLEEDNEQRIFSHFYFLSATFF